MPPAADESRAASRALPSWGAQATLVLRHEVALELRSGEVVMTSAFFAVLVVVLASFAFYAGPRTSLQVSAGAIWLAIAFAAVLALGRSWQREREEHALSAMLVSPMPRSALFVGKALALWAFLSLIEVVIVPLCALFFSIDVGVEIGGVALLALAATPGIAASGTLFGAMTVRTRARDLLLATVLFPLMAPQLLVSVVGTRELLLGAPLSDLSFHFGLLLVFDAVFVLGGLSLFGALIDD
jgi:heme exporter protein B